MRDDSATSGEKADAARKAIEEQVSRTREAREGLGVDRHLFGLYNIFLDMRGRRDEDFGVFQRPGLADPEKESPLNKHFRNRRAILAGFGTVDDEVLV